MNITVRVALAASLAGVIFLSCAGRSGKSAEDEKRASSLMKGPHGALHGSGCPREHRSGSRNVIAPREFFDTGDLGRGHDSLYGGDDARFSTDRVRCGERRREASDRRNTRGFRCPRGEYRDYQDAISERYAPPMNPADMGYDE